MAHAFLIHLLRIKTFFISDVIASVTIKMQGDLLKLNYGLFSTFTNYIISRRPNQTQCSRTIKWDDRAPQKKKKN